MAVFVILPQVPLRRHCYNQKMWLFFVFWVFFGTLYIFLPRISEILQTIYSFWSVLSLTCNQNHPKVHHNSHSKQQISWIFFFFCWGISRRWWNLQEKRSILENVPLSQAKKQISAQTTYVTVSKLFLRSKETNDTRNSAKCWSFWTIWGSWVLLGTSLWTEVKCWAILCPLLAWF